MHKVYTTQLTVVPQRKRKDGLAQRRKNVLLLGVTLKHKAQRKSAILDFLLKTQLIVSS